ncbi:MAG TPA: hypothetical protein VGB15_00670, partial [Longimicrobium sp.]
MKTITTPLLVRSAKPVAPEPAVRAAWPGGTRRALETLTPWAIIAAVVAAWWVAASGSLIFPTPPETVTGLKDLV